MWDQIYSVTDLEVAPTRPLVTVTKSTVDLLQNSLCFNFKNKYLCFYRVGSSCNFVKCQQRVPMIFTITTKLSPVQLGTFTAAWEVNKPLIPCLEWSASVLDIERYSLCFLSSVYEHQLQNKNWAFHTSVCILSSWEVYRPIGEWKAKGAMTQTCLGGQYFKAYSPLPTTTALPNTN